MDLTPVKLDLDCHIYDDEVMRIEDAGVISYEMEQEIENEIEEMLG